ncbi:thioredoxin [archaeon]|nr:MAG: thioredoxin [archaeon]
MELIYEVSDRDFNEKVIEMSKKVPVIVDFWAPWCYPCHILSPVLEKIVKEHNGKVVLAKINVDENPKTAMKFVVTSIPRVILFKNGEVADEFIGAIPEPMVRRWLSRHIR